MIKSLKEICDKVIIDFKREPRPVITYILNDEYMGRIEEMWAVDNAPIDLSGEKQFKFELKER